MCERENYTEREFCLPSWHSGMYDHKDARRLCIKSAFVVFGLSKVFSWRIAITSNTFFSSQGYTNLVMVLMH